MDKSSSKDMTILEHAVEVRSRLIIVLMTVGALSMVSFAFSKYILDILLIPILPVADKFYFFAPHEAFFIKIKCSLFGGIIISSPVIIYQIWTFVSPGLYQRERMAAMKVLLPLTMLFLTGAFFAYSVVIPFSIKFLLSFQTPSVMPMLSISESLNFIMLIILVFGITFDFPVVLVSLMSLKILSVENLIKSRPITFIMIFIFAAMLTPPDVFSQILLALPLAILYEITIIIGKLMRKK